MMSVSRRNFIIGGSLLPFTAMPQYAAGFEGSGHTLFVILDGLEDVLTPALTAKVLDVFFISGIPVTALFSCADSNGFSELLRATLAKERGLIEVAFDATLENEPERYFRLRSAIELRDCMAEGSDGELHDSSPTPIVSILNRGEPDLLDPFALRGAGLRIQLRPRLDEDKNIISSLGDYSIIDWGLAQITGGALAAIENDPDTALASLGLSNSAQAFYLSFRGAAQFDEATLLSFCSDWAARLQSTMLDGSMFLTRPMDHLLQGNPGASKYVGLALDMSTQASALSNFAQRLELAGFPFSYLDMAEQGESCSASQGSDCIYVKDGVPVEQDSIAEIVVQQSENPYFWNGPRSDGRYHVALRMNGVENFSELMEQDPLTDTVLAIRAEHVATAVQQEALFGKFSQVRSDGKAHFYSIRGFANQTLAPDPITERFWSARRRVITDPPILQALDLKSKEAFLDDARLAWRFIERYTNDETGICAGTVQTGAANAINPEVTLWDVASQIHGIISARFLTIITDENARDRIERLLSHLPAKNIDGLSLPPALFSSSNPANSRSEFDACDTGRFLIALNSLVDAGLVARQRALVVFEQWDIAETVKNKRPFNYDQGAWEDVAESHCSHYARNGYIAWGVEMGSAYPPLSGADNGDNRLRLLYKAANIGHFGTEPLLLEAVETGFSPEAKYLSDVLFDAQLSWFEDTGQYKCVSEAALDFAPWFSYQGLRVDRRGQDSWVISTINNSAYYQSEAFLERADVISSKAAYLWAAAYPHEYSNRLVGLIRDKAKIDNLGFSIGVFGNTQMAMNGYSDINTNGIILTAIAEILQAP